MKKLYTSAFSFLFFLLFFSAYPQDCNLQLTLPYYQNFQNVTPPALPPCTVNQTISPVSGDNYWRTVGPDPSSGNVFLRVRVLDPIYNNNHWFFLPKMNFDANRVYKISNLYSSDNPDGVSAPRLTLAYGICANSSCMTNVLTFGSIYNTSFQSASITFTPTVSGTYYIGFNHMDKPGYPGNSIALDSIVVQDVSPLPVSMSPLRFTNDVGNITLRWQTFTEQNNHGYQIEQSKDGRIFKYIGFVSSRVVGGNSNSLLNYEYLLTTNILSRGNFFRLRQSDMDNHIRFSNIVNVTSSPNRQASVTILGNPVGNLLSLSVFSLQQQQIELRIADYSGRQILRKSVSIKGGYNLLSENVQRLAAGHYYLTIIDQQGHALQQPLSFTK